MIFKRTKSAFLNQRGFTLVELLMVIGILAALASIGAKALTVNRQKSYDAQVMSLIRSLLTVSAIDEPVADPSDPDAASDNYGQGGDLGFLGQPFHGLEVAKNIYWRIENDGNGGTDKWQFYLAHPSGENGYYFWIPGDGCNVDIDGHAPPNNSDKIVWRNDAGQYRNRASDGALP